MSQSKDTNKESKKTSSLAIVDLLRYTYRFAEGKRSLLCLVVFIFVVSNLFDQLVIALSGKIFNYIQVYGVNESTINNLLFMVSGFFILGIIFWVLHGPARIIEQKIAFYTSNRFREYLYKNTLLLPLSFHNGEHSGQIISKINKGVVALDIFVSHSFILIRSFCSMIGVIIALYIFDYRYATISLVILITVYYVNFLFEKRINPYRDAINKKDNIVSEIVYDTISNITTIKMLSLANLVYKSLDAEIKSKYEFLKKKIILNEVKWFMPSLFGNLFISGVLLYYILSAYTAGSLILIGSLYILYGYLNKMVQVFNDIAWLMSDIQDEARDIINSEYLSDHFSEIKKVQYKQIPHINSLVLRDLDFKYSDAFNLHIDELKFEKGKSYALVGESGCGKTTTMKILASLIEAEGYSLLVNGDGEGPVLGDKYSHLEHIREAVMLIPQEPELFSNTIRENITLGLPFTEDEVNEVLDMVNMKETVDGLPEGRESKVFEKGVNLSGGQKQRLALARGILFAKSKEMILLDEPTSSVDQDNEERIYESLIKIAHDKILISSVHKKNLLKYFDYVIHFEKGRVKAVSKSKFL